MSVLLLCAVHRVSAFERDDFLKKKYGEAAGEGHGGTFNASSAAGGNVSDYKKLLHRPLLPPPPPSAAVRPHPTARGTETCPPGDLKSLDGLVRPSCKRYP